VVRGSANPSQNLSQNPKARRLENHENPRARVKNHENPGAVRNPDLENLRKPRNLGDPSQNPSHRNIDQKNLEDLENPNLDHNIDQKNPTDRRNLDRNHLDRPNLDQNHPDRPNLDLDRDLRLEIKDRWECKKKKRKPNNFMIDLSALRSFIKSKLPNETLNNVGAMAKAASKLLTDNGKDIEKAKKDFDSSTFMKEYNSAKKAIEAKQAAKKANKM